MEKKCCRQYLLLHLAVLITVVKFMFFYNDYLSDVEKFKNYAISNRSSDFC